VVKGSNPKSGPEIESIIVDVDPVGAGACTAFLTLAGPLVSVVQVNIPIMNISPARWTMEAGKLTI
jgi:hypothetical protein